MTVTKIFAGVAAFAIAATFAAPAVAQDQGEPGVTSEGPDQTIFDGDYLSVGVGLGYAPSYTGSDDYVTFVFPVVQGSYRGIDINPRPAGVALDFLSMEKEGGPNFSLGIAGRINTDRTDIDDTYQSTEDRTEWNEVFDTSVRYIHLFCADLLKFVGTSRAKILPGFRIFSGSSAFFKAIITSTPAPCSSTK